MTERDGSTFNLRALVAHIQETSHIAAPTELARRVFDAIDEENYKEALRQALYPAVHVYVSRSRMSAPEPVVDLEPRSKGSKPSKRARGHTSADQIRDIITRRLQESICVGERVTDWKPLAMCTADDLKYAAENRYAWARGAIANGDRLTRLSHHLVAYGVEIVGDLPEDVQREELANEPAA